MELRQLHDFVAVAEELHFTRAAARLNLAQSPLSRQIRELERELGVQLLRRNTRSVTLTDAGRVFLQETRNALRQIERASLMAQQAQRGEVGELLIGFITSASYDILPVVFQAYRERFPNVDIVPCQMTVSEQVRALQERRLHAGIVREPVNGVPLAFERLQKDTVVVAVPQGHPLAACRCVSLEALKAERLIFIQRKNWPGGYDQLLNLCHRAGFNPAATHEAGDLVTLLGLVAAGLGVALVPASAHQLRTRAVVCLPFKDVSLTVDFMLAWDPVDVSPLLQGFLSTVHDLNMFCAT